MRTAAECDRHADFCERQAVAAIDRSDRAFFLDAAKEWRKLAQDRRGDLRSQPFMMAKRG